MEIKIQKVELAITNNGTVKAYVFPEGSDINNIAEAIEIIGDTAIYLATRKKGETIEVVEKNQWKNVVVPKEYQDVLNTPSYERIKLLFKRSVSAMNKIANGSRVQLDFDTAKLLVTDNLELFLKTQQFILDTLKSHNTTFSKQLIQDTKSEDATAKFNAWKIINDLTYKNLNEISKDYRILNDGEEVKQEKTPKK
jgi:hypothetical protein